MRSGRWKSVGILAIPSSKPGSARMSLTRPRHGLECCWLVRLASLTLMLGLALMSGCGGSVAAPAGAGTTPVGIAAIDDGHHPSKEDGAVNNERQPLEAPA